MGTKLDSSPYSSLGASFEGLGHAFSGSGSGNRFGVGEGYSDYSSLPTAGVCVCVCVCVSALSLSLIVQV